MHPLASACYTLPNGSTRTGKEIAEALERCAVMDPAAPVTGWSREPMTAGAAVEILSDALNLLKGAGPYALTLDTYTAAEIDAEAEKRARAAQREKAEAKLREPLTGRAVACQAVLFSEFETLFSGRAFARK
jgi:hypothetical protein